MSEESQNLKKTQAPKCVLQQDLQESDGATKSPSTDEWANKWHTYTMEYHSAVET